MTESNDGNENIKKEEMRKWIQQQNFMRRRTADFVVFLVLSMIALLYLYIAHDINGVRMLLEKLASSLDPGPIQLK